MNPIEKILEYRLNKIKIDFNIREDMRFLNWVLLEKQFILRNYITELESNMYSTKSYCYWIIKRLIWKGIIDYKLVNNLAVDYAICTNMLYHEYFKTEKCCGIYNRLVKSYLLNKNWDDSEHNLRNLWNLIINYFMLIDTIVGKYMVSDLDILVKQYMYGIILL